MIKMRWEVTVHNKKLKYLISRYIPSLMNIVDLLPVGKNLSAPPKLGWYGLFRKFLLLFVVLGGLFMIVDMTSDRLTWNSGRYSIRYNECDDNEDVLGHEKFKRESLNAEELAETVKCRTNTLNLLKEDISSLKHQVMTLWNSMNEGSSKCEVPKIDEKIRIVISESNLVDNKIKKALDTYDADKLALYDYAAEYAGGEVLSILDTTPYPTNKIMQIFGLFKITYSSSPTEIIKPSTIPGDCFKFYGSKAKILLKLGKKISIGSVSMEHSPLVEDFSDAPKFFNVYGLKDTSSSKKTLLGSFVYDVMRQESIQNFPISKSLFSNDKFEYVELGILENHGNPHWTSIYRFRVHSGKNKEVT